MAKERYIRPPSEKKLKAPIIAISSAFPVAHD